MPTCELLKGFSTSLKQGLDLWSRVQTERDGNGDLRGHHWGEQKGCVRQL